MATSKHSILITSLLFIFLPMQGQFYTKRDFLQKSVTEEELEKILITDRSWISFPDYESRTEWDLLTGENKSGLIADGERYLDYEWQYIKATDYLEYIRSGNRTIMEDKLHMNRNALHDMFLAELAEGQGRFIDQIVNGVFFHCEMTSWDYAAHNHSLGGRPLPDSRRIQIDLASSDTGALLSWIHYFLEKQLDKIDPAISSRIREEIGKKILHPYSSGRNWWWTGEHLDENSRFSIVNNWTPWISYNLLQCFLLMEEDTEVLRKAVYRTLVSTDKFINSSSEDGACSEGPIYWRLAAGNMFEYIDLLDECTVGNLNVFKEPLIRKMGEYYADASIGNGWVVNFADAAGRDTPPLSLLYRYGKATDSRRMRDLVLSEKEFPFIPELGQMPRVDFYNVLKALEIRPEFEKELSSRKKPERNNETAAYDDTQFYFINRDDIFFAGKAGYNEESHNHNDVGSFVLYKNRKPVFIDAGVAEYTRQTFDNSVRYGIWTMRSDYHNLPVINGTVQRNGYSYKASDVIFDSKKNTLSADISGAYPEEAGCRQWIRTYRLEDNRLIIEDDYRLDKITGTTSTVFLTPGTVECTENGELSVTSFGEKTVMEFDDSVFDCEIETIDLKYSEKLSSVWGDEIYRITFSNRQQKKANKHRFIVRW